MKERKRKRRSNSIDFTGYSNDHCTVLKEIEVNKWLIECKYCDETHEQDSKGIRNNARCRTCKNFKPHNYSGLDRWDTIIRRTYGITLKEYDEMLYEQGNGCAICGRKEDIVDRRLAINHCHITKTVRGILCSKCNQGLGLFEDNVEFLSKAAQYLKVFNNKINKLNRGR